MAETAASSDAAARRDRVARHVIMDGDISVEQLAEICGVSVMTIYRDVNVLEKAGIVHREHGRIHATASGLHEASARFRLNQQIEAKKQIARAAATLIPPSASIIIDDSTSAIWTIREIEQTSGLSIVTNSLMVAEEFRERPKQSLFLLGGEYQRWAEATVGPSTVEALTKIDADICLLSTSGIRRGAILHPYADAAAVKSQMMRSADKTILLVDHTKWARRALHTFGSLADVEVVVVDADTPAETIERIEGYGTRVLVAGAATD